MRRRAKDLHPSLRFAIAAVVAFAWLLGAACCLAGPSRHASAPMPAAPGLAHGIAEHVHHPIVVHRTAITRSCVHHCTDPVTPALWASQEAGLAALALIVAMVAVAAPFAGPVTAGTRDPPPAFRAVHDHLGRNILTRICICRR